MVADQTEQEASGSSDITGSSGKSWVTELAIEECPTRNDGLFRTQLGGPRVMVTITTKPTKHYVCGGPT